ncbi:MAG: hypothetical protein ACR2PL_21985 [Dehalococcoidia bacterium]
MKSVRLPPSLETKLRQAAKIAGTSESAFIREAIEDRCNGILSDRADLRLADVVGGVDLGGGVADETGRKFTELLEQRKAAIDDAEVERLAETR